MITKLYRAITAFTLFLASCATHPTPTFQTEPLPNPDAPLAFFGVGNADKEMRLEYAVALQNSGIYNFATEVVSEEQVENAIEIRLNYSEEKGKFNSIPILVLQAELLKNKKTWLQFTLKEESDKVLYSPWKKSVEKKFRKQVLQSRFLEEIKRVKPETPPERNNG